MELNKLIRRIINTINYSEMCVDVELCIDYVCDIFECLATKNIIDVTENIILPLMDNYSDSENEGEKSYIKDTVRMIQEYLSK